jgi:hypothetical protein
MDQTEISQINAAWNILADIPAQYEAAWTALTGLYTFKSDYDNPLYTYSGSDVVSELRTKLIKFVIAEITENVNYEVDGRAIYNHVNAELGEHGFDAQIIVDFITEQYEAHADELSLKAIKKRVRVLRPHFIEDGEERVPELNELVKKDTLTLRCYLSWLPSMDYIRFVSGVTAFEQYVRIDVLNELPGKVKAWQIAREYTSADGGLGARKIVSDIFESAQLYKNATVRIRFKAGYAERIAKAILRDFYEGAKKE